MSDETDDEKQNEKEELDRQEQAKDMLLLQKHTRELMSRFDTVQIICTKHHADDGTISAVWGAGNFYARRDSARDWIMSQDARTRAQAIRDDDSD